MAHDSDRIRLIFGLKIKHLRQEKGVSLSDLATRSGLSVSYLNEIEKGKKYPKTEKIFALAAALGVDYDTLVSAKLSKKLEPIAELLDSNLLHELPLELFGLDAASLLDLLSNAPSKVAAFVSTLLEISRSHGMRVEQFFFSALRTFQEMHDNHFDDLEAEAAAFLEKFNPSGGTVDAQFLETWLQTERRYLLEPFSETTHPDLASLRSVLVPGGTSPGATPRLLLNEQLGGEQRTFTLAREVGYEAMRIPVGARPLVSSVVEAESFEQVLNNFRASYFARAVLMPKPAMVAALNTIFGKKAWDESYLPTLLTRFQVTPEMLLLRMSNLLTSHFNLNNHFFLRFDHAAGSPDFSLAKEMHLSRHHSPHATTSEHYCRRWIALGMLKELEVLQETGAWNGQPLSRAQRSAYFETDNEYLVLALAKPSPPKPGVNSSVCLGMAVDDSLRKRIRFLDDPALPRRVVNETCERCPIADCRERVAPPTEYQKRQRIERLDAAVRALQGT